MSGTSSLFTIPPGVPFAKCFAKGFYERFGEMAPEVRARTRILVNTALARETIEMALADCAPMPGPLPKLVMIPDIAADLQDLPPFPPPVSPLRRHLRLTRLVEKFLTVTAGTGKTLAPLSAAPDLAAELALLIDQFNDAGVDASSINTIETADLSDDAAQHWQEMRRFLEIVHASWPEIRDQEEGGRLDARERLRRTTEAIIAFWAETPPDAPVIAAATTGSVGSTADLLAAVAQLSHGSVVFPSLDPDTPDDLWEAVGDDHPMGPFQGVLERVGVTPSEVGPWTTVAALPRADLLRQALRPAPVTDHWHTAAPLLADKLAPAIAGLSLIEADSPRLEADAIAVAIRECIAAPGRTVTLVTPDAAVARRVTAALARFEIVPDDTMGQPLLLSPAGRLLRLALDLSINPGDLIAVSALLQHPMTRLGRERSAHLAHARAYERQVLRKVVGPAKLPEWPDATADQAAWLDDLSAAGGPLSAALGQGASLTTLIELHREMLVTLTAEPNGTSSLSAGDDGAMLLGRLDDLVVHAEAFGAEPVADYRGLLAGLLADAQLRPKPRRPHPRVSICGPREARLVDSDRLILAGLNDNTWPPVPDPGPWLSRPMREAVGLPTPERTVGLSAHDFLCAASGEDVILARARKIDGAATVASRWLTRIETLVAGVAGEDAWNTVRARGQVYHDLARRLTEPDEAASRAPRPRPKPPVSARPRALPVTAVETLVRDAYAVYARYILRLRPVEPLGRPADMRDRGNVVHTLLERFVRATVVWPGRDAAAEVLDDIADDVLSAEVPWPDLRRIWKARVARFAPWFLDAEHARRSRSENLGLEVKGKLILDLPAGPFELSARADRIDKLNGGGGAVFDYKAGAPPSGKLVETGFNHQIHVAAAILQAGGFDDLPTIAANEGAYIGLTGSNGGGKITEFLDLPETLPERMAHIRRLLAAYDNDDIPYTSQGRPQKTAFEGDYDHLARVGEWQREDET